MTIRLIVLATAVAGGSAISAYSYAGQAAAAAPPHGASHFASQMCDTRTGGPETPASDHHAHLAASLGLSADQHANIERIAREACAAMTKYHEQILAELTPDQRAKLQALHGQRGAPSAFHRLMRKLHGG